jgi:hypothetical protein
LVVEALEAVNTTVILGNCMYRLNWLEEAWYEWVIADEMAWNSEYEKAAAYVKRSLRWLKRILKDPRKSEGIRVHVEWLVREIESINATDARVENQIGGLTPRFRQIFFELLARCLVEEAQAGHVFKPPQ